MHEKILISMFRGARLIDTSLFCANVVEEQRKKLSDTKCMIFFIIINSISNANCHNQKQVFICAYNFQGKLTYNQQNISNLLLKLYFIDLLCNEIPIALT